MIPSRFGPFLALVAKWNRSINLTAATSEDELAEHLEDSLHVVPHLTGVARVVDVGSGGGFPVVVAALELPDTTFVALEPIHKKHAFLRTAARELGLANLTPLAERLEDHRTRDYDAAMSRATFDLREWLERGRELVHDRGIVLGFEATTRNDLPSSIERHTYHLGPKVRSIIIAR
jgi:16S rRNA (guanine527-N7)-methyltransferase